MSLTDTAIKAAKLQDKPYKLSDGSGLYLYVNQTGKYFRMDYRFAGKKKLYHLENILLLSSKMFGSNV